MKLERLKELAGIQLDEASKVSRDDLDDKVQDKIKGIEKDLKVKAIDFFDGIHGVIVVFSINAPHGIRLDNSDLKALIKYDIRWLDVKEAREQISVGL